MKSVVNKLFFSFLLVVNLVYAQSALSDGALIKRQVEDAPIYSHYGVMYKGHVTHYDKNGVHVSTIEEFAKDHDIKVVCKGLSKDDLVSFYKRYQLVIKKYKSSNYNALYNNCEHFAIELVTGIKKSFQSEESLKIFLSYWNEMKKQIMLKNPNSQNYIKAIDIYIDDFIKKN